MVGQYNHYELLCVIVDFGKGSKIIKTAKKVGITGATVLLGKGTAHSFILDLLDLTDIRKEIVLMLTPKTLIPDAIETLKDKFQLEKPNHGIAFTMPVNQVHGMSAKDKITERNTIIDSNGYQATITIVDHGRADDIIDAAVKAGAKGGTIITGHSAGVQHQEMLFSFPINPAQEIVVILAQEAITKNITDRIHSTLATSHTGQYMIFTLEVNQTIGLY